MIESDLDDRLERTLTRIRAGTGVSLAFGGPVTRAGSVALQHFVGPTVGALPGVRLEPDHGLGGRSVQLRRPLAVHDYVVSPTITHRYDAIIRAEGLRSMVAAPVIVGRRPVGIVYGAFRGADVVGGRIQDVMAQEARALEQELAVRAAGDDQRVAAVEAERARLQERMRATYAELRRLVHAVDDARVSSDLLAAAERLVDGDGSPGASPAAPLTEREVDVLALAAAGDSNGQIASTLGLGLHTVKGYMKAAMAKLDASSRLEAVVRARRAGLLP